MSISYDPDTQPFDLAYSHLPFGTDDDIRGSLVDVADTIDMAKRILLQYKVRNFSATDVISVAQMIVARRADLYKQTEAKQEELRRQTAEE